MQSTVLDYLENSAEKFMSKTAIIDENEEITFGELRGKAINLAEKIVNTGIGRNQPVLIYLPKSVLSIVAMCGVLYSGNFYTPTDVRFPVEKIKAVLNALNPRLIITNIKYKAVLEENKLNSCEIVTVEDVVYKEYGKEVSQKMTGRIISTDPVYTFFTSGSTGVPKGVIINNQNIIDYIDFAQDAFKINEETIMGNQSPLYFDISTQDVYTCLSKGAELVIIPERFFAFPVQVLNFINEKKINFLYWVPSAFVNISTLKLLDKVSIPTVKTIMFGGEVMPVKHLNYWLKYVPSIEMTANVYGPTEATVNCTYYIVDREFEDSEVLPLGQPCYNTDLLLFDEEEGKPVTEENKLGELYVRGVSLSMGYWNAPEKTKEMYVQNPLHKDFPELLYKTGDLAFYNKRGELVFAGRKDFQIKHMGYRIELGEIESFALTIEGITNCCCIYDKDSKQIILCYTAVRECTEESFVSRFTKKIPKYMQPTKYVRYKAFPINDNGKIDRVKLGREARCK